MDYLIRNNAKEAKAKCAFLFDGDQQTGRIIEISLKFLVPNADKENNVFAIQY